MRSNRVVHPPPRLDHPLILFQRAEDLPIQQFISYLPVERLNIAVLPRAAGFNEQRFDLQGGQPAAHALGSELSPIVRSYVNRHNLPDQFLGAGHFNQEDTGFI